ncbi:4-hydroxybenzoate 3-monooxygenase [Phytoactinopolyspora endophytica]|uniref:4-hydroxybenzoate 3-monooxygenase n=1 Tax=Phytoactinopolyspora endophytica TaxID=1642495 RepID=UPI00101CD837|nr:4-hydroxybenzoate 3-monooxygenase [Phytoactinopolyspora endophytica]
MRTQVGIVGAGPAGLLLSHLLHLHGISSVVLEAHTRDYVEHRVRAGVLEQGTVNILREAGLGARLDAEGMRHEGIELRFDGEGHRVPMAELTGRAITVYGQQEVVKDLVARRLADGADIRFEVSNVRLDGLTGDEPTIRFHHDGKEQELICDVIAGCDGFHGISRPTVPAGELTVYEREYPFAWLGILAEARPAVDELIYCLHHNGFALYSMRSEHVSRLYLQVPTDEDIGDWPDDRIWEELATRFRLTGSDWRPTEGPIFDKGVTPMRSFVTEPMQYGRLLLAGDAVHIVPPTGAKGLNLAVNDVWIMSRALDAWFNGRDDGPLRSYTRDALQRVWRAQHFSWWMTSMLHRFGDDPYQHRLQIAQLRNVVDSPAYATALSENYVG